MKSTINIASLYYMVLFYFILVGKIDCYDGEDANVDTKSKRFFSVNYNVVRKCFFFDANKIGKTKPPESKQESTRLTKIVNFFVRLKNLQIKEQSHSKKINYFHLRNG